MMRVAQVNRREFLCGSAATLIVSRCSIGETAPSNRTTVGVIGLGARGFNLLDDLMGESDARIVAVCDVDRFHYRDRPWGKGPAYGLEPAQAKIAKKYGVKKSDVTTYDDYRELIARTDLDAVVIATPDHWHALCTLEALRAGKDVYCEKPVTHTFHEGQLVYHEVAKQKAVFQTGSQQRSDPLFRRAVELVRNGVLGKVQRVEVGLPPGYDKPQGDPAIKQPPEQLDYNFWTGPAPLMDYMRARHHRWWRGHRAYGGGVLMDWIGHHNDIAHWALDMDGSGPQSVEAVGWKFPTTKVYDTPQDYEIRCEYPGGISSVISSKNKIGTRIVGEDGWIYVNRGQLSASNSSWLKPEFLKADALRVYDSPGHMRNFLNCVKSRKHCIASAETAHRSITPGHLAYVSHELDKPLKWDAKSERVTNDERANELLGQLNYRKPWSTESIG